MELDLELKETLDSISSFDECAVAVKSVFNKYETIFSINYMDYEKTEIYKTIKAYKRRMTEKMFYVMVVTEYHNRKPISIKIGLMDKEPHRPHELFPVLLGAFDGAKVYEFGGE